MPRGVNPSVWGIDEISSSCELIFRVLVIDDHLLGLEGTFVWRSNRSRPGSDSWRLPIWGRCRPGLAGGVSPDQAACLAVDDSDRHGPRVLCRSTAFAGCFLMERVRRPEELHPVSAPNVGLA